MFILPVAALTSASPSSARPPPEPRQVTFVVNAYANVAPDGSRLVYQSDASGNWDLYVMSADGTRLRQITDDPAADITPVFSPDGQRILFVSERLGDRDIYVCDADSGNQRLPTNTSGHDIHPVWTSGGRRIMFSSNRGKDNADDYDIYEMATDGSDVPRITSGPEVDTYASRSPDGSWIAFSSGREGAGDDRLRLIRPDGTGRIELTRPHPNSSWCYDTQPTWTPDGRRIVFTRYRPGADEIADLCIVEVSDEAQPAKG